MIGFYVSRGGGELQWEERRRLREVGIRMDGRAGRGGAPVGAWVGWRGF